jgi:hypothetical protein
MLFAYTGMASWQQFETLSWLSTVIFDVALPWRSCRRVLAALRKRASKDFASDPILRAIPREHARLSVLFCGYRASIMDGRLEHEPFAAVLSNFQDLRTGVIHPARQDEFALFYSGREDERCTILGAAAGVSAADRGDLHQMAVDGRPVAAMRGKAKHIIDEASQDWRSANTVGPNMMFATLTSDRRVPPQVVHHSATGGDQVHLIGMVSREAGLAIAKIRLQTLEPFPATPRPNNPCPCGSGKKYKRCHGRPEAARV